MGIYQLEYYCHHKDTAVMRQLDGTGTRRYGDTYNVSHGLKNRLETAAIKGEKVESNVPELTVMITEAFERMRAKGRVKP